MVKLACKFGMNKVVKQVDINPSDKIDVLLEKLNITGKNTKFIYNGRTYSIGSIMTFEEIGLVSDSAIFINNIGIGERDPLIKLRCKFGNVI